MKRWLLAAACGVVALGLLLYPLVGELLSEKYHSDIETSYSAAIEDTDDAALTAQREAAKQYNAMLSGAAITEGGLLPLPWPTPNNSPWAASCATLTFQKSMCTCRYSMERVSKRWSERSVM